MRDLGVGLGLRTEHYALAASGACDGVDWFEAITENFLGASAASGRLDASAASGRLGGSAASGRLDASATSGRLGGCAASGQLVAGGNPRRVLRAVREHRPIALHGVSLSIGSIDPLDERYLRAVRALVDEIEPAFVSDHLCWSSFGGHTVHDLWPMPYTSEALEHVVARVAHVQERLGRRIYLENPSSYVAFRASELSEAEFLGEVARRADCGILLDVNNVFVSCRNHRWDIDAYLAALPLDRIGYLHIAGHSVEGTILNDTHDTPVSDEVWTLYRDVVARIGRRVPACLERDANIPAFDELVVELAKASQLAAEPANTSRLAAATRPTLTAELTTSPAETPKLGAEISRR